MAKLQLKLLVGGARRNSGNSGNGGNDGKMIIIIIDYVGDGGNDIQRLERYFLHGLAESTRKTYNLAKRRYSEFASKHGFQPLYITNLRTPAMSICKLPGRGQAVRVIV